MNISEQTVKNHVVSLMRKLKARNRTHAVVIAIQKRIIVYMLTRAEELELIENKGHYAQR